MEVLRLLGEIAQIGNQNAVSDAAVGAQLALAAIKGAHLNVDVNLSMLPEPEAAGLRQRMTAMLDEANRSLASLKEV
jgi:glutamate formiminotransferase/formiminotetrahydrofolate cyclodeaminase